MKNRKNSNNNKYNVDIDDNNLNNPSNEEIIENIEERFSFSIPSRQSPPKIKLIFSIVLDIMGFFAQFIPFFGITIWPSLSTYLIYKVYGSGLHLSLSFIEETIPGLGFIPTATICYLNERYNLISYVNRYLPTKYIRWFRNFITFIKTLSYGILVFIIYKLFGWFLNSQSNNNNQNPNSTL